MKKSQWSFRISLCFIFVLSLSNCDVLNQLDTSYYYNSYITVWLNDYSDNAGSTANSYKGDIQVTIDSPSTGFSESFVSQVGNSQSFYYDVKQDYPNDYIVTFEKLDAKGISNHFHSDIVYHCHKITKRNSNSETILNRRYSGKIISQTNELKFIVYYYNFEDL